MRIPHDTVVQLCIEGIKTVADLADFDKDSLEAVARNLKKPAGQIPDLAPGAAPGAMIPTTPLLRVWCQVGPPFACCH